MQLRGQEVVVRDAEPMANLEAQVGKEAQTRLFLIECAVMSSYYSWERRKSKNC